MTDDPSIQEEPRANSGFVALSIFGWLELSVSVIAVVLNLIDDDLALILPAIGFGIASIVLGFAANQVRKSNIDYRGHIPKSQRKPEPPLPPEQVQRNRRRHTGVIALGIGALALSGLWAFSGATAFAIVAALWAVSLGNLSTRYRTAKGA